MPLVVPLEPIPAQEIQYTNEGVRFTVTIRDIDSFVLGVDVSRFGTPVVSGVRGVPNQPILPGEAYDLGLGNFHFETPNGELPKTELLGITHFLMFVTPSELAEVRNAT